MIKKVIVGFQAICVAISLLVGLSGCSELGVSLVNVLAESDEYKRHADIPYGSAALNVLDVYVPVREPGFRPKPLAGERSKPTIVFFYGGCWGGCKTLEKASYRFVAETLTAHGYKVVIPDYRRYPQVGFEEIIADAALAVEWVHEHIDVYGGDPREIVLMGHSAGAHLAAMLTLNEEYLSDRSYSAIRGFVGLAGPYDFLPFTEAYQVGVFAPPESYPASQPINFVDGTEPPLLLLYGLDDKTVKPRNIASLERRVKEKRGQVTTHLYEGVDHVDLIAAFSIPFRDRQPVVADVLKFLQGLY